MIEWTTGGPRLNPETQQMLARLPLTKAFLAPISNEEIWARKVAAELKKIRREFEGGEEKTYNTIIDTLLCYAKIAGIMDPNLSDEEKRFGQEILIALGFEAKLKKVKPNSDIFDLITTRLIDMGFIYEDAVKSRTEEGKEEIFHWLYTSWYNGYSYLPSVLKRSTSQNRKTGQPSQDNNSKEQDLRFQPPKPQSFSLN
jgi:hypothetical protein